MDIEVERYIRSDRGRTENGGEGVTEGQGVVIGVGSVVSQTPLSDQEPSAFSTIARSSLSWTKIGFASICPKTMGPFTPSRLHCENACG